MVGLLLLLSDGVVVDAGKAFVVAVPLKLFTGKAVDVLDEPEIVFGFNCLKLRLSTQS